MGSSFQYHSWQHQPEGLFQLWFEPLRPRIVPSAEETGINRSRRAAFAMSPGTCATPGSIMRRLEGVRNGKAKATRLALHVSGFGTRIE